MNFSTSTDVESFLDSASEEDILKLTPEQASRATMLMKQKGVTGDFSYNPPLNPLSPITILAAAPAYLGKLTHNEPLYRTGSLFQKGMLESTSIVAPIERLMGGEKYRSLQPVGLGEKIAYTSGSLISEVPQFMTASHLAAKTLPKLVGWGGKLIAQPALASEYYLAGKALGSGEFEDLPKRALTEPLMWIGMQAAGIVGDKFGKLVSTKQMYKGLSKVIPSDTALSLAAGTKIGVTKLGQALTGGGSAATIAALHGGNDEDVITALLTGGALSSALGPTKVGLMSKMPPERKALMPYVKMWREAVEARTNEKLVDYVTKSETYDAEVKSAKWKLQTLVDLMAGQEGAQLPDLKNTGEAVTFGESIIENKGAVKAAQRRYYTLLEQSKSIPKGTQQQFDLIQKAQLYREAVETATKKSIQQEIPAIKRIENLGLATQRAKELLSNSAVQEISDYSDLLTEARNIGDKELETLAAEQILQAQEKIKAAGFNPDDITTAQQLVAQGKVIKDLQKQYVAAKNFPVRDVIRRQVEDSLIADFVQGKLKDQWSGQVELKLQEILTQNRRIGLVEKASYSKLTDTEKGELLLGVLNHSSITPQQELMYERVRIANILDGDITQSGVHKAYWYDLMKSHVSMIKEAVPVLRTFLEDLKPTGIFKGIQFSRRLRAFRLQRLSNFLQRTTREPTKITIWNKDISKIGKIELDTKPYSSEEVATFSKVETVYRKYQDMMFQLAEKQAKLMGISTAGFLQEYVPQIPRTPTIIDILHGRFNYLIKQRPGWQKPDFLTVREMNERPEQFAYVQMDPFTGFQVNLVSALRAKYFQPLLEKARYMETKSQETADLLSKPIDSLAKQVQRGDYEGSVLDLRAKLEAQGRKAPEFETLSNYYRNLADDLAHKFNYGGMDEFFAKTKTGQIVSKLTQTWLRNLLTTFTPMLSQAFSLASLAASEVGIRGTVHGSTKALTSEFWAGVKKAFTGEDVITIASKFSQVFQARQLYRSEKVFDYEMNSVAAAINACTATVDRVFVAAAFYAGLQNGAKMGLTGEALYRYSDNVAARVNGVYESFLKPRLMANNALFNALFPMMTSITSSFRTVTSDVWKGIYSKGDRKAGRVSLLESASRIGIFFGMSILIEMLKQTIAPSSESAITSGVINQIPILGNWGRVGGPATPPGALGTVASLGQGASPPRLVKTYALLAGKPGTYQLVKTLEGFATFLMQGAVLNKNGDQIGQIDTNDRAEVARMLSLGLYKTKGMAEAMQARHPSAIKEIEQAISEYFTDKLEEAVNA